MQLVALGNRIIHRRPQRCLDLRCRMISSASVTRKELRTSSEVEQFLSQPTWSVNSLLPTSQQISESTEVTKEQLHHLLRLSALNLPKTAEEEAKMLRDLRAQLHFVKEIQKVDTEGVEPLRTVREESIASQKASAVGLDTLKVPLSHENTIGSYHKRIRRRHVISPETRRSEDWDVLGQAPNKVGRFFVVNAKGS